MFTNSHVDPRIEQRDMYIHVVMVKPGNSHLRTFRLSLLSAVASLRPSHQQSVQTRLTSNCLHNSRYATKQEQSQQTTKPTGSIPHPIDPTRTQTTWHTHTRAVNAIINLAAGNSTRREAELIAVKRESRVSRCSTPGKSSEERDAQTSTRERNRNSDMYRSVTDRADVIGWQAQSRVPRGSASDLVLSHLCIAEETGCVSVQCLGLHNGTK